MQRNLSAFTPTACATQAVVGMKIVHVLRGDFRAIFTEPGRRAVSRMRMVGDLEAVS
jgi:hypothetical protein